MKSRICFVIVLFILTQHSLGQDSYSIADSTKAWSNVRCYTGHFNNACCCQTITNRPGGDTIINGGHYLKVYETRDSLLRDWNLSGFLKESRESHKVFFRNLSGDEGLIYDFGLKPMGIVRINNTYMQFPCPAELTCYLKDSVLVNGVYRARYFLGIPSEGHEYMNRDTWIEGIGSVHGVFSSGYLATGYSGAFSQLQCYSEHNAPVFRNPAGGTGFKNDFHPAMPAQPFDTAILETWYELIYRVADPSVAGSSSWYGWSLPGGLFSLTKSDTLFSLCDSAGNFPGLMNETNCGYTQDVLKSHSLSLFQTFVRNKFPGNGSSTGPHLSNKKVTLILSPSHTGYQYEDGKGLTKVKNRLTNPRIIIDADSPVSGFRCIKIYITDSEQIKIIY
jgi:hypothetical protein